ncbi:hypothetical protein J2Y45_005449 [Dyadobacter sp. BE34]|uniref:Lipoprotein n=1 Tax=Dyadobacter fermentans TaxID=94254 RepID=A0ABU1R4R4_9BACT|nr:MULTISPECIES: hypothetical protein [Dyadobacter]MDR6808202.1 hypothetical protein [Dyadobacter fermentans]MDR7045982.1 hypothetical protein [Dyadobacter sp. BE242]MDR7200295.1 hypothetical protein [Dyadobacter sp. BE34]MDR7218255.1 hypothetical protein [Dyadobacter sp. BE31]MDR7266186.1 hypothetical protein [Dyadobacter sp. BE32]
MKRKMISCASALFFLAVFNCKRDMPDPECRDASCCNPYSFDYVEYIVDEPVALGPPCYFRFTRKFPTKRREHYWSYSARVCEKSIHKLAGFPLTYGGMKEPDSFPYRVSGKLLDWNREKYLDMPILALYIDKIEKIN